LLTVAPPSQHVPGVLASAGANGATASPGGGMYLTSGGESSSEEGRRLRRRQSQEESAARTRALEEAERERRVSAHREAHRETQHERRHSIKKAVAASEAGRMERIAKSTAREESLARPLAFVGGGELMRVVPAAVIAATPATARSIANTPPVAPAAAAAIFPGPPAGGLFDDGATPQFGERLRPTWSGEVPPPPSTPPPFDINVRNRASDDDDDDDDDELSDGDVVMVEDDDRVIEEASGWVLVEVDEDILRAGTGDDTESLLEDDENAARTLMRATPSPLSNTSGDAALSAGRIVYSPPSARVSPRSPELERLGVRANMLSPEQLNMEISKIKLAISSRKKMLRLGDMQTPSPLSWRLAVSENADFS
jgi:hypothetical protein